MTVYLLQETEGDWFEANGEPLLLIKAQPEPNSNSYFHNQVASLASFSAICWVSGSSGLSLVT